MQSQKWQNDLCSLPRQTINITVIKVYAPTTNAKGAKSEWSYDDLQDLLELTPKKRCPFHHRGLECKSRKSRDTRSNRQSGLGVQNEAGQRLTEFCQENAFIIANILFQYKRWLYTWTSLDGQYQNQLIIFFCSWRWSSIWSAKSRLGADYDSYHELLIAKFRLKLKKVRKNH